MFDTLRNKNKYGDLIFKIDDKSKYRVFETSKDSKEWGMRNYGIWGDYHKTVYEAANQIIKTDKVYEPIAQDRDNTKNLC